MRHRPTSISLTDTFRSNSRATPTTAEEDAANAAAFIRALRNGEVVLAVWYQGDTYAGSSIIEATEKPQTLLEGRNVTVKVKKWAE